MNHALTDHHAPVDHPGTDIPDHLRNWNTPWPDYLPGDITPPELRLPALAGAVESWITDTAASPAQITDWNERRQNAVVPFQVSAQGWPLNPTGRTGRWGRNLGSWGENAAADPVVVAGSGTNRRILLIQRGDIGVWALPGGMVDPGETAPAALVRELAEETGVDLTVRAPEAILRRGYVADWRATDNAWVCSTAALYTLPETLPAAAADDAVAVRWAPFSNLDQLADDLVDAGGLYEAHRPILATALDHLD